MLLLAFLEISRHLFVLAAIGVVDGTLNPLLPHRPVPFLVFFVYGTAVFFRMDGINWNGNVTFFWLLLYSAFCGVKVSLNYHP